MSREMKSLMRFSLQHSDGTTESNIDPERAQWLRNAMENISMDLPKQLKEDIDMLTNLLSSDPVNEEDCVAVLDDISTLTEDIDLANDFYKMGGINLLLRLLFESPRVLRSASYRLLAHTTQNNPYGQKACLEKNILPRLLHLISEEQHLGCVKDLLLAVSCLTRGNEEAVCIFHKENGLVLIIEKMQNLLSESEAENNLELVAVWKKASFVIYCVLQELLGIMSEESKKNLANGLIRLMISRNAQLQEHLLASMILLLTNNPSVTDAIDFENVRETARPLVHLISPEILPDFQSWLNVQDRKLGSLNDPANAELQCYIGVIRRILSA